MSNVDSYAFLASSAAKAGSSIMGGLAEREAQMEQARISREQAAAERYRAEVQAQQYRRKEALLAGRGRAIRAASGVDITTGTPALMDAESAREGEFGAQQLLAEGALRSYRYEQEANYRERAGANALRAGFINAGTTFLTAAMGPNQKGWGSTATKPSGKPGGKSESVGGMYWDPRWGY